MSKYGEPWRTEHDGFEGWQIFGEANEPFFSEESPIDLADDAEAIYKRAAACVNALAHVPGDPAEYVEALETLAEDVYSEKWCLSKYGLNALDKLDALRKEGEE